MTRRSEIAFVVFSAWVIAGLFVDGWAHNADKPESFWTPWHALLYSGFVAGVAWGALENRRQGRRGVEALVPGGDAGPERLATVGVVLFAGGGVADSVWHSIFGVEADIEALVSPSHLVLMIGGLLLTTTTFRSAWRSLQQRAPSLPAFLPALLSLTLSVSVVSFFLQYVSSFRVEHHTMAAATDGAPLVVGLSAIQLTNLLLLGPMLLVLRRWRPPTGSFTLLFGLNAVMMSGLRGFEHAPLAVAALAGGATADLLVARQARPAVIAIVTPVVLWASWFAAYDLAWGLGWSVELWSGSLVFAALGGYGLALLAFPPTTRTGEGFTAPSGG